MSTSRVIDPNTGNIVELDDGYIAAMRDSGVNYEAAPPPEDPEAKAAADEQNRINEETIKGWTDPSSPTYYGPGYTVVTNRDGTHAVSLTDQVAQDMWVARGGVPGKNNPNAAAGGDNGVPQNPNAPAGDTAADITGANAPSDALNPYGNTPKPVAPRAPISGSTFTPPPTSRNVIDRGSVPTKLPGLDIDASGIDAATLAARLGAPPPPQPGDQAPDVDRSHIDPVLDKLNSLQNQLISLSANQPTTSVAEAQLLKSQRDAAMRNALGVQQSQAAALGQARSARGRGDRALLERGAVGEAAYIGQEGQRQDAQNQTATEGQLAVLRAQEDDQNRRFRADTLKAAADLGLNAAAVETDISKTNLSSANNWINNEFQQLGINKQIDQQQTEALLNFSRDMALIQADYDKMSLQDQQHTEDLIMQKYGIDQQTMVALKQIKESGKFHWDQFLGKFIAGAGEGGGGALTKAALASDVTLKTNIRGVDPNDAALLELLSGGHAYSFEYRSPEKHSSNGEPGPMLGIMAQELERTKLGKSMVSHGPDGKKRVDVPKLASAAFAGTKLLLERVARLEKELS